MFRSVPGLLFPAAAILLLVLMLGPIAAVLTTVSPVDVAHNLGTAPATDALRVSLVASSIATLVATALGIPAGYWLARGPRRLAATLLFVLALPLAFPPVASGIIAGESLLGVVVALLSAGGYLE